MTEFIDTIVCAPNSRVTSQTAFIIMSGPTAITTSYFSLPRSSRTLSVTKPLPPFEPSSVIMWRADAKFPISRSYIKSDSLRAPSTTVAGFPTDARYFACGYMTAPPMPPPTSITLSYPVRSVGLPRGPTKSAIPSPAPSSASFAVVAPTVCTRMVTVPSVRLMSQIVKGTRSPSASTRSITNCPGFALRAAAGAAITYSLTFSASVLFASMRYIFSSRYKLLRILYIALSVNSSNFGLHLQPKELDVILFITIRSGFAERKNGFHGKIEG